MNHYDNTMILDYRELHLQMLVLANYFHRISYLCSLGTIYSQDGRGSHRVSSKMRQLFKLFVKELLMIRYNLLKDTAYITILNTYKKTLILVS